MKWLAALVAVMLAAAPALADDILVGAPTALAVTIYRDPVRNGGGGLDLGNLTGFALVTETRRVRLPAGTHRLRFEGVADGILSQSAVIAGLPQGVVEKNRDARTLSPASLVAAALGQHVTLRRTDPATGRKREISATVVSGPEGGVLFRTSEGVEALRCSALPETLVFDAVPAGLSDRPVLSVVATSRRAVDAVVTLAYLARGFDWTANYVARVAPDGRTLDLTGWITLANGGSGSLSKARTQVVAGKVERDYASLNATTPRRADRLFASCWPWDTTSTAPVIEPDQGFPPPPPAPMAMMAPVPGAADIVVSGARREELGDLKLYTVPERVTVAAHAQKQLLLIDKPGVPFSVLHRIDIVPTGNRSGTATILVRMKNDAAAGLGEPLPGGQVAVLETVAGRSMLVGQNRLRDTAVAEKIEIAVGRSNDLRFRQVALAGGSHEIRLTNARAEAATVEVRIRGDDSRLVDAVPALRRIDGDEVFAVVVPAEGETVLRYRIAERLPPALASGVEIGAPGR
ncbi:DUF4139 domain-containing protein [Glacieibacterium sp.]|uniref:DUF4139 domain-containing protein n=1 Tax=Glacieibacterium sp. TaxID=2860237 RepID=UPI003B00C692